MSGKKEIESEIRKGSDENDSSEVKSDPSEAIEASAEQSEHQPTGEPEAKGDNEEGAVPNPARALDPESLHGRLADFVEEMINPSLASHGGWVEIDAVDEEKGLVTMKMGGGCHGCGASAATMKYGIETAIKDEFPEVLTVEDATDHSTGENPFFMGNPFAGF